MSNLSPSEEVRSSKLVADRRDFFVVYVASLASMLSLLFGARVVQFSTAPLEDLFLPLGVGALLCLVPTSIAAFVPSHRRSMQVMFGVALLPVVGAIVINAWQVVKAIAQ